MKRFRIVFLMVAVAAALACGGAGDLLGTRIDKTYQVQGRNTSNTDVNIVRDSAPAGIENQVDAHTQRELPSIPLGFDTPFSEHTVVFRVIESNVEVGATAVPISGDQASSSEDWIIVTWDGATLDASLANDPLKR